MTNFTNPQIFLKRNSFLNKLNNIINNKINIDNPNNQPKPFINYGNTYCLKFPSFNNINNNIKDNNNKAVLFPDNIPLQKEKSKKQKSKIGLKPHKNLPARFKKEGGIKAGKHINYRNDCIRKKVKHLILKSLMKFVNMKLKILYNGKIGYNILRKEFLILNKYPVCDTSIEYNKLFLKKTLKEILSENISTKYTNYKKDFNKKLIENLMNEKDKEKREYFRKLFNFTFLDCLKHFNRTKNFKEFDGMDCIDDVLEEFNNDKEYKKILYYNIKHFDDIINNKRSRKSQKRK